jgi:hypothetical protein
MNGIREQVDETRHTELLTFYNQHIDHLRELKEQQWAVTNYILVLIAGAVGGPHLVSRIVDSDSADSAISYWSATPYLIAVIAIGGYGSWLLWYHQKEKARVRGHIEVLRRRYFPDTADVSFPVRGKEYSSPRLDFWSTLCPMWLVTWTASLLSLWILCPAGAIQDFASTLFR